VIHPLERLLRITSLRWHGLVVTIRPGSSATSAASAATTSSSGSVLFLLVGETSEPKELMAAGLALTTNILLLDLTDFLALCVGLCLDLEALDALSRSCLGLLSHISRGHEVVQGVTEDNFFGLWLWLLLFLNFFLLFGFGSSLLLDWSNLGWSIWIWRAIFESATLLVRAIRSSAPVASAMTTFLFVRFSSASASTRLPIIWMGISGLALEATTFLLGWVEDSLTILAEALLASTSASSFTSASSAASSIAIATTSAGARSSTSLGLAANEIFESALGHLVLVDLDWLGSDRLLRGDLPVLLLGLGLGHGLGLELVVRVRSHVSKYVLRSHNETQCYYNKYI